jgi:hypothetical protein
MNGLSRFVGELPRAYWIVWVGTLINRLGGFFVSFMVSWGLATFVAPIAGTQLLARAGGPTVWGTCFAIGVAVAVGHLAVANARRRRLEELAAS